MQVKETVADGLKHEFQISVPASDLDAKADARLVDLKDKVRLNGFRPGKVPVSHLKKVYGRSVMAETVEQTIRDTNSQIFTERGFRLATEPKVTMPTEEKAVEDILTGKSDLTYTVSIEVVPAKNPSGTPEDAAFCGGGAPCHFRSSSVYGFFSPWNGYGSPGLASASFCAPSSVIVPVPASLATASASSSCVPG